MNLKISKEFEKSARKLSGKYKESLKNVILEVRAAQSVSDIGNCKKLIGYNSVYRIRMGDFRMFFLLEVVEQTVFLNYLVSRGDAYSKEYQEKLKRYNQMIKQPIQQS
jgi:mRNA-degrading endonuclease RelE of RelBE toxin-antitoxin system